MAACHTGRVAAGSAPRPRTTHTPAAPLRAACVAWAGSRMPPIATTGTPAMCTHQLRLSRPWARQGMALVRVGQTGPQATYHGARLRARASSHRLWLLMPSGRPQACSSARPASPRASRSSWPRCTAMPRAAPAVSSAASRQWSLTTRVAPASRQAPSACRMAQRNSSCQAAGGAAGVLMRNCTVRAPAATTWRTRSALSTMAYRPGAWVSSGIGLWRAPRKRQQLSNSEHDSSGMRAGSTAKPGRAATGPAPCPAA